MELNEKTANDLRCYASEIVHKLWTQKYLEQLKIFKMYVDGAVKDLEASAALPTTKDENL